MASFLLDANHLSTVVDPRSGIRERVYQAQRQGHRIGTCVPVLCEVAAGLEQTRRRERNRQDIGRFLRRIRLWPIEPGLAWTFADVFLEVKRLGRVLSQVDMMLAAMARQMKATILTTDRDFECLSDIHKENWLLSQS